MGGIRKSRLILALVIAVSLLTATAAAAQTPPPPYRVPYQPAGPANGPGVEQGPQLAVVPALGTTGVSYRFEKQYGTTRTPYIVDTLHLNRPVGLTIDQQNNDIYLVEEKGHRLLKFNAAKQNLLVIGEVGFDGQEDYAFGSMNDVALDSQKHIWVTDWSRVVEYAQDGTLIRTLPETNSWESGSDHGRFNNVRGVAFDGLNHMFVADNDNHRVEVFTYDPAGSDAPVYLTTIPFSGAVARMAVDSANNLYVPEPDAGQVQKCFYVPATQSWTCSILEDGLPQPEGVAVDTQDRVYIGTYGSDSNLYRCDAGACSIFRAGHWATDVAVSSTGVVFTANPYVCVIETVTAAGSQKYLGVPFTPYVTKPGLYYKPRVEVDAQGNLLILEADGQRLSKVRPDGSLLWTYGTPGIDNLNEKSLEYPDAVAVDAQGKIYIGNDSHVTILDSAGKLLEKFYDTDGTFDNITGLAVDKKGNLYVSDMYRHRVLIYNTARQVVGQIGQTDNCGTGPNQLCGPAGLTLDSSGNLYIAEAWGRRMLKYDASRALKLTIGKAGEWGNDFAHFSEAQDVAVDAKGRIFVADIYNNRVQVFDPAGKYLTTLGGSWGDAPTRFRNVMSVAVDSQGSVYAADWTGMRVQKFTFGTPGWVQANINGFGKPNNVSAYFIGEHNGMLYASGGVNGYVDPMEGAEIYRSADGSTWTRVATGGLGDTKNQRFLMGVSYKGYLYTGTDNNDKGAEIWRCAKCDGSDWVRVLSGGAGKVEQSIVEMIVVHDGALYASLTGPDGLYILRSTSGASGTWNKVNAGGFGNPKNIASYNMIDFNGSLYVATSQWGDFNSGTMTGMEVWRCKVCTGGDWVKVNQNGFGDTDNIANSIAVYNGALYLSSINLVEGAQVWRCTTCGGGDWKKVFVDGGGDSRNAGANLVVYEGSLYNFTSENWMVDNPSGGQLFISDNGTDWSETTIDGLGDVNNGGFGGVVFNGSLFITSGNWGNGAEIWQMLHQLYIPAAIR